MVAVILPIAMSWVSGYYRHRQFGQVDNKNPREQCARLTGAGARAVAAQQNSWEALAMFTAAVVAAQLSGVPAEQSATAALLFIVARVVYLVCYLANQDALRSLAFLVGFGSCIWLFVMGA
jgi:uncharacterized MAPEG superfamily protein